MHARQQAIRIALLAAAAFIFPIGCEAEGLGKDKNLETQSTAYDLQASSEGIGADQQEAVSKAASLVQSEQYAEAEKVLDGVLAHFSELMRDGSHQYVTFRSDDDYRQFMTASRAGPGGKAKSKITRVHDSFAQALQLKAYIASSLQKWDEATEYLDRKISYAPYEAQPHLEKGYVLNAQGKPGAGLESYKKAYELAVAH
ncbi:MAG TPA: hypothetical protein VIU46_10450, partial [Gallionellaceae bacterium]